MTRLAAALSLLGLMISASGCCHHLCGGGYGGGGCGPCGANYGGYPGYSQAYAQPSYATAAIPTTGFVSAAAPAACDCNNGGAGIAPY